MIHILNGAYRKFQTNYKFHIHLEVITVEFSTAINSFLRITNELAFTRSFPFNIAQLQMRINLWKQLTRIMRMRNKTS